jgi:hypothetical protein
MRQRCQQVFPADISNQIVTTFQAIGTKLAKLHIAK